MRRYHRDPAILDGARHWRDRALLGDGSVFTDQRLWTLEHLAYLERHYIENPDMGSGGFLAKLQEQLDPTPPTVKKLGAEILWVLYLGVSQDALKGGTKRLHIKRIWEWSGEPLPEARAELAALDGGMANPGTAYHTHKWREFSFAIQLTRDFKRLGQEEKRRLLQDPWGFAEWMDGLPSSAGRQFRHFVLALLFPDHFERIVTSTDKQKILRVFLPQAGGDPDGVNYKDRTAVDRALFDLRGRLEQMYDADPLDYYQEPLRTIWKKGKGSDAKPPEPESDDADLLRRRIGDARVWVIAAGEGARAWPEFRSAGIIAIGWDHLGDLSAYGSREEIHAALHNQLGGNPVNGSLACWQFAHEIRPGDHVLIKQGRSVLLGAGVVQSEYRFDDTRAEFQHVRDVEWQRSGHWELGEEHRIATKTLTEVTLYRDWLHLAFGLIDAEEDPDTDRAREPKPGYGDRVQDAPPEFTLADAMESLFLPQEKLSGILDALGRKKNVILEGPPGVGKTFVARRLAWALMGRQDNSRVEMVQFHQSYAYEDFVQGWRPRADGGFELQDGTFHRVCRKAEKDPLNRYVFVIDEINRGNLSKVLGELMMLIESDKRGPGFAIPLTYSRSLDERFFVPENVYVLGMMNTADRSLAMVDYALRRRFSFVRLEPAFGSDRFTDHLIDEGVPETLVETIVERMTELNRLIAEDTRNLGSGFEIGHSFFVPAKDDEGRDEEWYQRVVRQEIEPLLHEYWFDQPERVEEQVRRLLA